MTVPWTPAAGDHAVRFYEGERFLHRVVADFLTAGVQQADPCVLIARPLTYEAVRERLSSSPELPREGADRVTFVNVDEALGQFMEGVTPDPQRFERAFSHLITCVAPHGHTGTIWICGEMVDVLCKAGNHAGAIQIEQLWNAVFAGPRYSVMCGYAIGNFDHDVHGQQFRAVCRQHTHVVPAEGFIDAPDDRARFEQVARLQQRVRALDGALAHEPPAAAPVTTRVVYVVDDDVSVRRSLARLLSSVDIRVQTFASAEAFLAEVDRTSNACLILDLQLLGMSGAELQRVMARDQWRMPIIAMSGSDDREVEAEAMRLGATLFLRKPFDAQRLINALKDSAAVKIGDSR